MRHVVVMVTTSYPRFPGDSVGTFMEPIAKHVAARGHEVHIVAPWHPRITRGTVEDGVFFHFFRYAPVPALNVFGYAAGLRADVKLKGAAWMAAPLALSGRLVQGDARGAEAARDRDARALGRAGRRDRRGGAPGAAARGQPARIGRVRRRAHAAGAASRRAGSSHAPASSRPAATISRGAPWRSARRADRIEVVPYGVDTARFKPAPGAARGGSARVSASPADAPLIVAAGRLVRKKGLRVPDRRDAARLPGDGASRDRRRRRSGRTNCATGPHAPGVADRVHFLGDVPQDEVGAWFGAADVVAIPSVRDDSGNVDGLPNTRARGAGVGNAGRGDRRRRHRQRRGRTTRPARSCRERDAAALAAAIGGSARRSARGARGSARRAGAGGGAFRVGRGGRAIRDRRTIARLPSSHSPDKI